MNKIAMLKNILIAILYLSCVKANAQTVYYVDQLNGSNANNGTSPSSAFKTFEKAKNSVTQGANSQGDTIKIMGTYHNPSFDIDFKYTGVDSLAHLWNAEKTIDIKNLHGKPTKYITITSYDDNTILTGDGSNIVRMINSSYVNFENFNIIGMVDSIPLSTANSLQFVYIRYNNMDPLQGTPTAPSESDIHYRDDDEITDGDGIIEDTDSFTDLNGYNVKRPSYIDTRGIYISNCHHVNLSNNKIHHMPGGGLRVSYCNDIEVVGNEIYRTSAKSYSGTHALVVTKTKPSDTPYSITIENNIVHHNYNEQYSWAPTKMIITPRIDEGKGISLQRNNLNSWKSNTNSSRILVKNNIAYWNGYSGFHSNSGYKIDFINNTSFCNHYTNTVTYANGEQKGNNFGLSAQGGKSIKFINNISVVSVPDNVNTWHGFAISSANTQDLEVINNISYDIQGSLALDQDVLDVEQNRLIADPLFVNAPLLFQDETFTFDFHLQSISPAISYSDSNYAPSEDIELNPRPLLKGYDNGAYEFGIYWNGKVNNDWHNAGNWSNNLVPIQTDSVTIPSSAYYQYHPEVFFDAHINKLYINKDAQLIIKNNSEFIID